MLAVMIPEGFAIMGVLLLCLFCITSWTAVKQATPYYVGLVFFVLGGLVMGLGIGLGCYNKDSFDLLFSLCAGAGICSGPFLSIAGIILLNKKCS